MARLRSGVAVAVAVAAAVGAAVAAVVGAAVAVLSAVGDAITVSTGEGKGVGVLSSAGAAVAVEDGSGAGESAAAGVAVVVAAGSWAPACAPRMAAYSPAQSRAMVRNRDHMLPLGSAAGAGLLSNVGRGPQDLTVDHRMRSTYERHIGADLPASTACWGRVRDGVGAC